MESFLKSESCNRTNDVNKVAVFDIDGVLNYYPKCWVDYINEQGFAFKDLNDAKDNLVYNVYTKLKEQYRTSGYKRTLPVRQEAKETLTSIKNKGYSIIIISARPVIKYPVLYQDTLRWLLDNDIPFDNLIFSIRKQYDVLIHYPQTAFIVEDNRLISRIFSEYNKKVFLLNNEYNQGDVAENVTRIFTLKTILEEI